MMLTAVVLLCLVASCLCAPGLNGRIAGGHPANISDFPYQLSMEFVGVHVCGAAIIGTSWAITVAHCVSGSFAKDITLRAGSTNRTSGGSLHRISDIIIHEKFSFWSMDYDVALIKVADDFSLGTDLVAVDLPSQGESVEAGSSADIAGWGSIIENGPQSDILHSVTVPVLSNSECNSIYGNGITDTMICAGYTTGGIGICHSDFGSVLVDHHKAVGLASRGVGCAQHGFPDVFIRVAAVRSWITANTGI